MTTILPRNVAVPDVFRLMESFPFMDRHLMRIEDFREGDNYVIRAELPGLDPERDITLSVDGNTVTIAAERTQQEHHHGRTEFHYGRYERTVTLPRGASTDEIEAEYDSGILRVTVPVAAATEAREIPVTTAESTNAEK